MNTRIMNSFNDLLFGGKKQRSINYLVSNIDLISNLDNKQKKYLIECIKRKDGDKTEWEKNFRSNVFLGSLMIEGLDKPAGINMLINSLKYTTILEEKLEIMWNLIQKKFLEKDKIIQNEFIIDIFIEIVNYTNNLISIEKKLESKNDEKSVVIIVNQFLLTNHAPTRDTLEYAKSLRKMEYEVYIFVTNEMPSRVTLPLLKPFIATIIEHYKNEILIDYEGLEIPIYFNTGNINKNNINETIKLIFLKNPSLVISVGGFSVIAEMIGRTIKLITLPCATSLEPSKYSYINVYFNGDKKEADRFLKRNNIFNQNIVCNEVYQYSKPIREKILTREEVGLVRYKLVGVVVGNRLDNEIDDEFIDVLIDFSINSNGEILVVGQILEQLKIKLIEKLNGNIKFIEFYKNLYDLYCIVDLDINPKRQGGGTSAAHAMAAGLPIYSLDYGDVSKILNKNEVFLNYAEMKKSLKEIDKANFNKEENISKFELISNKSKLLERLIKIVELENV